MDVDALFQTYSRCPCLSKDLLGNKIAVAAVAAVKAVATVGTIAPTTAVSVMKIGSMPS